MCQVLVINTFRLLSLSSMMLTLQPKIVDEKQTTVYKRAVEKNYNLKLKASRSIFSEINQKFSIMPFTARWVHQFPTRAYNDQVKA